MNQLFVSVVTIAVVFQIGTNSAQPLDIVELVKHQRLYDRQVIRLRGILTSGHVGVFLKDDKQQFAVRIKFEKLPAWASKHTQLRDALFAQFEKEANSLKLPAEDKRYEVELICVLSILTKRTYDLYSESPLEIYPLRILHFDVRQ